MIEKPAMSAGKCWWSHCICLRLSSITCCPSFLEEMQKSPCTECIILGLTGCSASFVFRDSVPPLLLQCHFLSHPLYLGSIFKKELWKILLICRFVSLIGKDVTILSKSKHSGILIPVIWNPRWAGKCVMLENIQTPSNMLLNKSCNPFPRIVYVTYSSNTAQSNLL